MDSKAIVDEYLDEQIRSGYEGLVIRTRQSPYVFSVN